MPQTCGLHTHTRGVLPSRPGASPGPRSAVSSADHLLLDLSRAGLANVTPSGSPLSFRARSPSSRWSGRPLNQDPQSERRRSVQSPPGLCFVRDGHLPRPPLTPRAHHHLHAKSEHKLESVTFVNRMTDMLNLQHHLCRGATPPCHIPTELPLPALCCLSPPPPTPLQTSAWFTPRATSTIVLMGPKLRPGSKLISAGAEVPGPVPQASPACLWNV